LRELVRISWPWIAACTASDAVNRSPSTVGIRPIGGRCGSAAETISADQLSRLRVATRLRGIIKLRWMRRSSGTTETDPGLFGIAADQARQPPFQHLDDRAFAAAAAIDAGDAAEHAVAVHDLAHLERRQEQIVAAAGLQSQEAVTVRVGDHHAGDQVHARRRGELALAVLQQLAIADHRAQAGAERLESFGAVSASFSASASAVIGPSAAVNSCRIISRLAMGCS
jgi:hypothetical protein